MHAARFFTLGYLAIVFGPLAALLTQAIGSGMLGNPNLLQLGFSHRMFGLLGHSAVLAFLTATLGAIVGVLLALLAWRWRTGVWAWLRWIPLAAFAIPPYLIALAWQNLHRWVDHLPGLGNYTDFWNGTWAAAFVLSMWVLPLCYGLCLAGLEATDGSLLAAASVFGTLGEALRFVIWPQLKPYILAAWSLSAALALTDYGTAALFLVNTYPLELYAQYSAGGQPGAGLLAGWPLFALTGIALWFGLGKVRRLPFSAPGKQAAYSVASPAWLEGLQIALALAVGSTAIGLLSAALQESWAGASTVGLAQGDVTALGSSLFTALCSGLLAPLLAWPVALLLIGRGRCWWLALVPLAVPAPLVGTGLIIMWNSQLLGWGYGTMLMPVLASLARFAPVAVLALAGMLAARDRELDEAAVLFEPRWWVRFWTVELPIALPGLALAGFAVACLSLTELGATLLIAPPGKATAVMRIYNYLHYGASANVGSLAVLLGAAGVLFAAAAIAVGAWSRRAQTVKRGGI